MKKLLLAVLAVFAINVMAAEDGATLYKKCSACHGMHGEKKALGKSVVINTWDAQKLEDALKGYKDGTFGGVMKGIMKGQVAHMTDAQIKAVSEYITTLKK
ncbi:c-type cytochrome [Sulfurospirillum sp. 1612]|uniref:c-type cytochrome n=1 Tax=Sulfurospirillum sp. 1612 TaxID=3094835 RepID=UPI002F93E76F